MPLTQPLALRKKRFLHSSAERLLLFTPAHITPIASSRATVHPRKSLSSPLLRQADTRHAPPPYSPRHMSSDDDNDDDDDFLFTSRPSSSSLRSRFPKHISTAPGQLCAGETETETDEPSRHLPTARITPPSGPLIPPNTLQQRLTPLLFEFSRLLSIVPAIVGTLYNLYHFVYSPPDRIDFFISALWSILTGYQCLALTTGLLTRWRLYYPPLSTLVRLLALQGICWPATHFTLTLFDHEKRPALVWALIGTTTSVSRSVQIWVTSNLWWDKRSDPSPPLPPSSLASPTPHRPRAYWKRWGGGGKWGGRRWDWREVGVKCLLPAGIVYFIMAWAEQIRREMSPCK